MVKSVLSDKKTTVRYVLQVEELQTLLCASNSSGLLSLPKKYYYYYYFMLLFIN
jgi:hypothetical protein